ncbi:hypothetical protein BDW72DRAFT_115683 [Aspergillus terricola var. indicus]
MTMASTVAAKRTNWRQLQFSPLRCLTRRANPASSLFLCSKSSLIILKESFARNAHILSTALPLTACCFLCHLPASHEFSHRTKLFALFSLLSLSHYIFYLIFLPQRPPSDGF